MKYLIIIISLQFWAITSLSQVLVGYITDSVSGLPVNSASISSDNNIGVYSNNKGYFKIKLNKSSRVINISHISYQSIELAINDFKNDTINIKLTPKIQNLAVVDIFSDRIINIVKNKPFYIIDYEFDTNYIIVLAYLNNSFNKPLLMLLNNDGDTISTFPVFKPKELFKDCFVNCYFVSKNNAFVIQVSENNKIKLIDPIETEKLYETFNPIVDKYNNFYYLKSCSYNKQRVNYFCYNDNDSSLNNFREITNQDALKRQSWGAYFQNTEFDIRFQELIINRPIYAPIIRINDTLLIFNFHESELEYYTSNGTFIKNVSINFHKNKNWKEELYFDSKLHKAFAVFRKSGITSLSEVNLKTGKVSEGINIPEFIYVEEIKINDGFIHFLYKEKINEEYKQLYKMKI